MGKVLPIQTGRSVERPVSFPDVILYRGRTGDGADCLTTFDRRTIVLSRPVAGLSCKIRLTVNQYQAVAVVARDRANVIRLMHRDPGLSVDLTEMEDFDAAEEYRDRLADFLDLPPLMLAGTPCDADEKTGETPAVPRRNPVRARRPRFLTRRKTGRVIGFRKLEGREIIARS
jgi:hypothetical protein